MTHPQVALGEIATLIRGITYKPSDVCEATTQSAVACMRTKNVQEDLDDSDIVWIPAWIIRNSSKYLSPGDILVSSANSWNLVGKGCWVPELKYPASAGGFISILRGNPDAVDLRYLYHWFISPQTQAKLRSYSNKTTNISNLDHGRTLATEIPLPPLEEQRRIAAILDKAQDMSRKSQLSGALASSLIESEMIRRFGRPGDSQAHSRLLSLVEAGVSVIDCPHSTPKWTEEGRVCLRTSNLGKGDWIWHDTRRISDDDFQERSRRAPLEHGDIVLSREGTVGIAAIVSSDMDACMGQRLVQLKLDARHLTPEYLLAQLLYLLKPERISHAMTGSTSKHINVKDLRKLKISCPPIEEQCAFGSFCKQTRKMRARIALLEKNSEILSRSIQAASFCS
jgi:type I restriction enzyme, S subunit